MTDTTPGLRRAIEIVQAEIERAEALILLIDKIDSIDELRKVPGEYAHDRVQIDAGLSALRTVLERLQQEIVDD